MATIIKWENADFKWNLTYSFTWEDVATIGRAAVEDWRVWEKEDKNKLIKLILKVHGSTITESKQKEIKQYKIKATDIKLVVKEVLGVEMIAENISI